MNELRATNMLARRLHHLRGRCEAFADLICGDRGRSVRVVTRAYAAVLRNYDSAALSVPQLQSRLADHVRRYGLERARIDGSTVAWRSIGGPKPARVATFHQLSEASTRVTVQLGWDPEGLVEKVGDKLKFDERQVANDLDCFKQFIEGAGEETGAWRGEVPRDG